MLKSGSVTLFENTAEFQTKFQKEVSVKHFLPVLQVKRLAIPVKLKKKKFSEIYIR